MEGNVLHGNKQTTNHKHTIHKERSNNRLNRPTNNGLYFRLVFFTLKVLKTRKERELQVNKLVLKKKSNREEIDYPKEE